MDLSNIEPVRTSRSFIYMVFFPKLNLTWRNMLSCISWLIVYLLLEPLEEVLLDLTIGLISSSNSSAASVAASLKCLIIFLSSAVASALLQEHRRVTNILERMLISSLPFSGLSDANCNYKCNQTFYAFRMLEKNNFIYTPPWFFVEFLDQLSWNLL